MAILNVIPYGLLTTAADMEATESVSITQSADKAEVVGEDGNIFCASYYNHNGEWTATGFHTGTPSASIGVALDMSKTGADSTGLIKPGSTGADSATGGEASTAVIYVTEITIEEAPEDFVKYTVKGQFWDAIVA